VDDKERARLRQQALTWLKADLAAWAKRAAGAADRTLLGVSARDAVFDKWQRWAF
jgi:hypothetical protein